MAGRRIRFQLPLHKESDVDVPWFDVKRLVLRGIVCDPECTAGFKRERDAVGWFGSGSGDMFSDTSMHSVGVARVWIR
jgi:hypothetical protein